MKSNVSTPFPIPVSKSIRKEPLYIAVKSGNLREVRWLVTKGAEINLIDEKGKTLLHKAIIEGGMKPSCFEVAVFLINNGSEDSFYKGYKALHLAAANCVAPVLKAFADKNHDFTIKTQNKFEHNILELILRSRNSEDKIFESLMTIPPAQKVKLLAQSNINKKSLDTNAATAFENFQKISSPQIDIINLIDLTEEKENLDKETQTKYNLFTEEDLTNFHIELKGLLGDNSGI